VSDNMQHENKVILVTGATGLIGRVVVDELEMRGYKVVALDNKIPNKPFKHQHGVIWVNVDITDNNLWDVLGQHELAGVIHAAAHPGGRSLQEPTIDVEVNVLGSMRIFEYCAINRIPIVYTSSSVIYGDQPHFPIKETATLNPGTIYGACKVACENYLRILGEGYGLQWVVMRVFSTYGAGHKASEFQGIVNVMLTQLMAGNRVVVKGSLQRTRDMVYVNDVACGLVDALFEKSSYGRIINLGTGNPVTIEDMINALIVSMGKNIEDIEIVEENDTIGDVFYNSADCTLAKQLLGYEATYSLEMGLLEVLHPKPTS
jgi:UDP-glucose 4-epimerase